jgi:hypothetical protein
MQLIKLFCTAVMALAMLAGPGHALTMTFNAMPRYVLGSYVENYIVLNDLNSSYEVNLGDGQLHLGLGGPDWSRSMFSLVTGQKFSLDSFVLRPSSNYFCADGSPVCVDGIGNPFDNVLLRGFFGGVVVAEEKFWMHAVPSPQQLSSLFRDIDSLAIIVAPPNIPGYCTDRPCTHFNIDDLKITAVSPVPLPASSGLLAAAIFVLGLTAAFRHRKDRLFNA